MRAIIRNSILPVISLLLLLFLFAERGYGEGSKELNTGCSNLTTSLYLCNNFATQCYTTNGYRSQFAVYNSTQSTTSDERLYIATQANESIYMGFKGSPSSGSAHIVYRICDNTGTVVYAEQNLPTTGTGFISTLTQACNGPNQLIVPPTGGYDAIVWTPPVAGMYYIEFSQKNSSNVFVYDLFTIDLFDITVYNTATSTVKPGRLYCESWQFTESNPHFTGINYILSDDGIVTSIQFSNMQGGAWIQYANQTGCGTTNWLTDRKSLFNQQALFPQYKIFLNSPDPNVFTIATTLGQIIPPLPYGSRNCDGTINFILNVDKPGNVEIDLSFIPATYTARVLTRAVVAGSNSIPWDGKDGSGTNVPNNVQVAFTIKYINGLTNLPLYDVEGNTQGFIVTLVAPAGTAPNVYWDDVNIWNGTCSGCQAGRGTNSLDVQSNVATGGCAPPSSFPACHKWPSSGNGWGNLNTINSWWYNVSTSTDYPPITEWRSPQTLQYATSPLSLCAGTNGTVVSVIADPNTEVYHWGYTGTGATFSPGTVTNNPSVIVNFSGTATSGNITVFGTNTNCNTFPSPTIPLAVTIHTSPTITLSGPAVACVGSNTNVYTTEAGNTNYVWTLSPGGLKVSGGTGFDNTVTVQWLSSGAQSVTVTCENTYGCSAVNPAVQNVTVNPLPTATVSGTTTVCLNSSHPQITFTGSSSTPPYTFTYNINGGSDQVISTTSGNSVNVDVPTSATGTYSYNLTNVSDGSSTVCSQAQSGTATVTVNPLPTATIDGTAAVCQGAASPLLTFTGASATPPYTFIYNVNGGSNQSVTTTSGNSVTVAAPTSVAGSFTYNLISVQDGSIAACSQDQPGSATITVNPSPTASISGTTAVCQNSSPPMVTFTGSSGTAPFTFTYNINGGSNLTISTTTGNSVTLNAPTTTPGTYAYNLVSVQDASITACSQSQTGTATVTVNPLPTASLSGSTAVCKDATAPMVTFTGASATAPYTFTYNINGGSALTVTTTSGNSIDVAAPTNAVGSFTYNLLSVQDGSSTTCSQAQVGDVTITVNPLPTASISGTTAVCQNATAPLLTFTGASSTAPYTFTYKINGGADQVVSTTSGNSVTVAAPTSAVGSFVYSLVSVQDGSLTACSQFQAGSATITVNPLPTAGISGTTTLCQNATAPFVTFTGASSTAPYTFTYNINGGLNQTVSTTGGNSVTVTAPTNVAGTFVYNLVSVQDGSATACSQAQSGNATITVNPLPTATISGTTSVCQNSSPPLITFTGSSATAPYTFTYNINGGASQVITTTSGSSVTIAAPTNVLGNFTYNLLSVHDGSPLACSQAQGGNATITVNPLPTATISGTTAVCRNSAPPLVTFTGASSTAPYTFTYKINGGASLVVSTTSGNSVTVSAPTGTAGTFIYSLVSVQDGSSTTCLNFQSGSATITVNPLPTATISGTTAVCNNSAAPLITFTGASATAPYTFTYNINGGASQFISTIAGNSVTLPAPTSTAGTFIYSLVSVMDGSSTACSQAQGGSATVTVNPLPYVNLTSCNDTKTTSTSRTFTLKGGSPPGGTYYIDGVPASGGLFNPSVLSTTTHLITYSYTDFNTCKSTSTAVPITIITGSSAGSCPQSFTDPRDNTVYKGFTLGAHCWMLSNLNYGSIMASASQPQSDNCIPEKYCLSTDATCTTYGGLYQWDELMQYQVPASGLTVQGLCPPEWHIPTQTEWTDMINAVSSVTPGDGLAGSYLKDPTPTFGFHALLDGIFYLNNTWAFTSGSLTATMFWTATTDGNYRAIARGLNIYTYSVSFYPSLKANAFPVRCVKD